MEEPPRQALKLHREEKGEEEGDQLSSAFPLPYTLHCTRAPGMWVKPSYRTSSCQFNTTSHYLMEQKDLPAKSYPNSWLSDHVN